MANRGREIFAWLITGLLVAWTLFHAVYETPYFQNCLGKYEESYQAGYKPTEKPPPGPIPIGVNAWHDTACTFEFVEKYHESAIALATIVLVLVTAVLALYTAKLWGETRNLAIETGDASRKQRRQTTLALGISRKSSAQQARDMRESLDIARESDAAARVSSHKTLELMEKNSKDELRAYVALEGIHLTDHTQNTIVIEAKNYGQTPAHELIIFISDIGPMAAAQMLHPGQITPQVHAVTALKHKHGMGITVISGIMSYRDIYRRWWSTGFEQRLIANTLEFETTGDGNVETGPHKERPAI